MQRISKLHTWKGVFVQQNWRSCNKMLCFKPPKSQQFWHFGKSQECWRLLSHFWIKLQIKLCNIATKISGAKSTVHINVLAFQKAPRQMFIFVTTTCQNFNQNFNLVLLTLRLLWNIISLLFKKRMVSDNVSSIISLNDVLSLLLTSNRHFLTEKDFKWLI